jgi:hypothetical protein
MAYQKLQASRLLKVILSNTVDIPNPGAIAQSGSTTASTTNKLTDTDGDFINKRVKVGDIVYAGTVAATVTAIDSATVLSTSATIPNSTAYVIYSQTDNPQNGCSLYCGTSGDISITTMNGDTVVLSNVPSGLFIPVKSVKRVNTTDTTASNIVALW